MQNHKLEKNRGSVAQNNFYRIFIFLFKSSKNVFVLFSNLVLGTKHRNFVGNESLRWSWLFQTLGQDLWRLSHMALDTSDGLLCSLHFSTWKADRFQWNWLFLVFQSIHWNQELIRGRNWCNVLIWNSSICSFYKRKKVHRLIDRRAPLGWQKYRGGITLDECDLFKSFSDFLDLGLLSLFLYELTLFIIKKCYVRRLANDIEK